MNSALVLDLDFEWLDEDDEDEEQEPLGELFIRDEVHGGFTQIDSAHLAHFVALYEREDDLLN
jgi:hypothetical protein